MPASQGQLRFRLASRLPGPLRSTASRWYWWWHNRGNHRLAALFDGRFRDSRRRLLRYHDLHRGERCFVIGNGPSLSQMDLSPLRNEVTIGANRIYLLFDQLGFSTSYFLSVNTLVIEQCADEIRLLDQPKFITWRGRRWMGKDPQVIYLDSDYTGEEDFAPRADRRIFEGSTVTYVALQLAYHMGFEQVILIGVDHHFTAAGEPNTTAVARGPDPDHFTPDYFSGGFRWQLPDLAASERAYRLAAQAFSAAGREIKDATVDGKLMVFPKVEYRSLFR